MHLVMPHDSLFREQERPAKASVVLKLRHRSLADGEPMRFVTWSPRRSMDLTPDRVVLVDAAGICRWAPRRRSSALSAEQALEEKLISTLEPVTGAGQCARIRHPGLRRRPAPRRPQETYDPDQTGHPVDAAHRATSGSQPIAAGVPGTASNAPNAQALPVYPQQTTPPQTAKTESGTYGVSKTVRHVIREPRPRAANDGRHRGE